ncbi:MAG: PIN domain-containing protein [Bacteroidota bacterium]
MKTIFLDSSFTVALIDTTDQNHEEAVALSKIYAREVFLTTSGVLLEIGNTFSRKFKSEASKTIRELLNADDVHTVHINETFLRRGLELYNSRLDKSWSLVDCVSFIVMKERNISVALTFDTHFEQAGFTVLVPS